jgi:hypothetical protein
MGAAKGSLCRETFRYLASHNNHLIYNLTETLMHFYSIRPAPRKTLQERRVRPHLKNSNPISPPDHSGRRSG